MSIIFVNTIGTRDVKPPEGINLPTKARPLGEAILAILEKDKDYLQKLEFPIIKPSIEYVLKSEKKIDRVILVATNKPEPDKDIKEEEAKFRENDTIEFANVIKEWIIEEYGKKFREKYRNKYGEKCGVYEIRIVPIPSENPNLIDSMYEFFGGEIKKKEFRIEDLERYYLQATGGIPAVNTAILLHSIRRFGEKFRYIYVSEKTGQAHSLQIGTQLLLEYQRQFILGYLSKHDYSAVLTLLKKLNLPDSIVLSNIVEHAKHRLYFDFETTLICIDDAYKSAYADDETRRLCDVITDDLKRLITIIDSPKIKSEDLIYPIRELFFNMKIKYQNEEFVDFLGRLFRFQECILRFIVEKELRFSTEKDDEDGYKEFVNGIGSRPDLEAFLKSQRFKDKPLDYTEPTTEVLIAILRYLKDDKSPLSGEKKIVYGEVDEILKKVNKLSGLRNKSIIAHGFEGVSKEILEKEYDSPEIVIDLQKVLNLLGISTINDPYEKIVNYISQKLKRY